MVTLDDSFIFQHFENICQLICTGPQGTQRFATQNPKTGNWWDLEASRQNVMKSVRRFLYLCRKADQISSENSMIPKWINDLEVIACQPSKSHISDTYRYARLVEAAEPITKFLLGVFDWNITNKDEKSNYNSTYLEGFDSRTGYYKWRCQKRFKNTTELLYRLKNTRNKVAHTAINFYTDHHACMEKLIFDLYSYIAIFYMVENVCKEGRESVRLKEDICCKIEMPEDLLQSHIKVELVDIASKQPISTEGIQVRLYRLDSTDNRLPAGTEAAPYQFRTRYFETYQASVIRNGVESNLSEKFTVGHDFAAGTIVRIGIPPEEMKPDPIKIAIKELVLGTDSLPGDVNWILERIENYEPKSDCFELARLLTVGAVTNNPETKGKYEQALAELKRKLTEEAQKDQPKNLSDLLNKGMESFRSMLSLPYAKEEDFEKLCDSIDALYELIPDSNYDSNERNIDQIASNAEKLVSGQSFTINTSAIDESKRLQRRLSSLKILLEMKERYPTVVLAEEEGLLDYIKDLHAKIIETYDPLIFDIRHNVLMILGNLDAYSTSDANKSIRAWDYGFLAYALTHDSLENVVRVIQSCSSDLIDLIDKCNSSNRDIKKYKQDCIEQIKELRDRHQIVPMIVLDDADIREAEAYHSQLKESMQNLHELICNHSDTEQSKEACANYLNFVIRLINNMSTNSFVQILCNSRALLVEVFYFIEESTRGIRFACKDQLAAPLDQCDQALTQLWNKFSIKPRRREGDKYYSTQDEVCNAEASFIADYAWKKIEAKYGTEYIPSYITSIKDANDSTLPKSLKAMMLYIAGHSYGNENETLIFLTKYAMDYIEIIQGDAYHKFWPIIEEKFSEMYLSNDPFEMFEGLSLTAKQCFLRILLDSRYPRHIRQSKLFLTAVRLNFSKGNKIIPASDLFRTIVSEEIEGMDYMEFFDYSQAVSLILQYAKRDEDVYIQAFAKANLKSLLGNAERYYTKHINLLSIDATREIDIPAIIKFLQRSMLCLSGKTKEEKLLDRYRFLYELPYKSYMNTSAWYELEKQMFNRVYILIQNKTDKAQQNELSQQVWNYCRRIPYDDRKAEILFTLAPYFSEQGFRRELCTFYYMIKEKISIEKTSVYNRLQVIATLFDEHLYPMNVPGVVVGAPVNMLMAIWALWNHEQ